MKTYYIKKNINFIIFKVKINSINNAQLKGWLIKQQ